MTMKLNIVYFPSMFDYATATSCVPIRVIKAIPDKNLDVLAPKSAPLYLQIDGPEENTLRIALTMLHPRVMLNSGVPIDEYIEPAYLILEKFEWFVNTDLPIAKAFVRTRGYDSVEVKFQPGRHYCRYVVCRYYKSCGFILSKFLVHYGKEERCFKQFIHIMFVFMYVSP